MYPTMPGSMAMMPPGPPMGMMPSMNMMPPTGMPMSMMGGRRPEYGYGGSDRFMGTQQVMQAPPFMMQSYQDRMFTNNVMQPPNGPSFEMEPEFLERVTEIPRVNIEHRERLVEVPQPQVVDRIVEVPMIQEIIKEEAPVMGESVGIQVTREAPVIEFQSETLPPMEICHVEYQDRYVEVPQIQEVLRVIPRIEVREIPIERIIQVPKKIIQEIERPIFRPVPHLVQKAVERQIPVPKAQIQTMEVVRQVPIPINQPVDVQVNYPMPVPYAPQPMFTQEVGYPVPQPYAVEVERRVEVPQVQSQVIEKLVEIPVAVPVQTAPEVRVQSQVMRPPVTTMLPPVEVSSRVIDQQTLPPQFMSSRVLGPPQTVASGVIRPPTTYSPRTTPAGSFVGPAATPPRAVPSQQVVGMPTSYGGGMPQTYSAMPQSRGVTYSASSGVIGPSQRVGAMTPPTPPIATRSMPPMTASPANYAGGYSPRSAGAYGGAMTPPTAPIASRSMPPMTAAPAVYAGASAGAYGGYAASMGAIPATAAPGGAYTLPSGVPTPPMPPVATMRPTPPGTTI